MACEAPSDGLRVEALGISHGAFRVGGSMGKLMIDSLLNNDGATHHTTGCVFVLVNG